MNYIELLKQSKTLICNYTETQTDTCGNSWSNEVWYKYNDKYICKYVNLNFITEHNLSETKGIWIDIEKMINCNEVTIDVIDNIDNVEKYCCKDMQDNGWYIERKDNKINLQEDYSAHFVENIKVCPWCGKKALKIANLK